MSALSAARYRDRDQVGAELRLTAAGRRLRLAVFWGTAPGARRGVWRSRTGSLAGWNVRVGGRGPYLTAFAHLYTHTERRPS